MADKNDFIVRIAAGSAERPQSAIYRIWSPAGKSDVYASLRGIAGQLKISLHGSGICYAGFTREFANRIPDAIKSMGGSRSQSKWRRKKTFGSSIVVPLQFVILSSELYEAPANSLKEGEIVWIDAPRQGRSLIISCIFSKQMLEDDQWPGRPNGTQLIRTKLLPNGEKFWLIWQNCATGQIEKDILMSARAHVRTQKRIPLAYYDENAQPRYLIFKEYLDDNLLVVLDTNAESIKSNSDWQKHSQGDPS